MSRPTGLAIRRSQHAPVQPPDRLPLNVAAPIVLVLAVLCWVVVWQVARLVF